MLEMTGSASKIEGLVQVLRESGYQILEISRTGRMAMRRGQHTSRVLRALGTKATGETEDVELDVDTLPEDDKLPSEFEGDDA